MPRGGSRALLLATAIAAALSLAGCSNPDADADAQGGFGLATLEREAAQAAISAAGGSESPVTGALVVESDGCFTWDSDDASDGAWLVWPDDATDDGDGVVLGDGTRVAAGDAITGGGALVILQDLPDGANDDSYFGSYGGFCGAEDRGVLVLVEAAAG